MQKKRSCKYFGEPEVPFLKDINNEKSEPKPHQNTIATILITLVKKEFVGIEVFGRIHRYYPFGNSDKKTFVFVNVYTI